MEVMLIQYIFILSLFLTWLAIGLLIWLYLKEKNKQERYLNKLKQFGVPSSNISKIPIFEKRIMSLESEMVSIKKEIKSLQSKGLGKPVNTYTFNNREKSKKNAYGHVYSEDSGSQNQSVKTVDCKIWVERMDNGMIKLKETENPTNIFLVADDKEFLLNIVNFDPSDLGVITILYKEVFEIPIETGEIRKIVVKRYPKYEKRDGFYHLKSIGELEFY